jgi:hypothetical protein
MRNELLQYNNLVKQYKEYYFNVYSFLVSKGWFEFEPCENTNNELWFDWLISSELYELYQIEEDIHVIDRIENESNKFDVEISDCKAIVPPMSFVCTIDLNSNIEQVIKDFNEYRRGFYHHLWFREEGVLVSNDWYHIEVDVINYNENEEDDILNLLISPDLDREFVEAFINKDNVYDLLKHWADYIVNSDIWWDYNAEV